MTGRITFHFDGQIAEDHQVSLRVLGNTLTSLQSAIDRAYLDVHRGHVWKYSRLKHSDYAETDFTVGRPRDGGYILDLIKETGGPIVKRIYHAIEAVYTAPWDEGALEAERLRSKAITRQNQLNAGVYPGRTIAEFQDDPDEQTLRRYGNRSIAKEIDQLLTPIRRKPIDDDEAENEGNRKNPPESTLELELEFGGAQRYLYKFDRNKAIRFHQVVSARDLAEPLVYRGVLRSLDRGNRYANPKAKLTSTHSGKDIVVHIGSEAEYQELAPYMQGDVEVELYASPILEFESFDPNAGDVFYIGMV